MTPERFRQLTEIYGAEPRRWPEAEREAALAYWRDHAAEAEKALVEASLLDRVLERHRASLPSVELWERIVASAPKAAQASRRRAQLWWQGAGFAGLGLAGALVGALMIGVFLPANKPANDEGGAYATTAFVELSYDPDER